MVDVTCFVFFDFDRFCFCFDLLFFPARGKTAIEFRNIVIEEEVSIFDMFVVLFRFRSFDSTQDIERGKQIGEGAFGVVYKGKWFDRDVAIKECIGGGKEPVRTRCLFPFCGNDST